MHIEGYQSWIQPSLRPSKAAYVFYHILVKSVKAMIKGLKLLDSELLRWLLRIS